MAAGIPQPHTEHHQFVHAPPADSTSLSPLWSRLPGTHIQVSLVDLVDDLQVPREQLLHQVHGPALQGLGKHRVVGVGKGLFGDVPGLAGRSQCSVTPQSARTHPRSPHHAQQHSPASSSQSTPVHPSLTAPCHSQEPQNWLPHHVGWVQVEETRWRIPTLSQGSFSMSTKILISSGMAMAGCVSFSWMATWESRVAHGDTEGTLGTPGRAHQHLHHLGGVETSSKAEVRAALART